MLGELHDARRLRKIFAVSYLGQRGGGSEQEARFSADYVFHRKFRKPPHLRFPTPRPLSYDAARRVTARRQLGETKDAFP